MKAERNQTIGSRCSPYLTVAEAARFLRFDSDCKDPENAFRKWARRWGVPALRRGRVLLFDPRVLEQMLREP